MWSTVGLLGCLFAQSAHANALSGTSSVVPFLLSPKGVDYLGWLTPDRCTTRGRCDVVIVNPQTGRLFVQQSDDDSGVRVYHERTWQLSNRVEYDLVEGLVHGVTDYWGTSLAYRYEDRNLVAVEWADGRDIQIEYDRKGRVVSMTDGEQNALKFSWGKDGRHRMINSEGQLLNWRVSNDSVKVTDSWGHTASTVYEDSKLVGWVDPRGLKTNIVYTDTGMTIDQAGVREWRLESRDDQLQSVEQVGSGVWSWQFNEDGKVASIVDPSKKSVKVLYTNEQSVRLQRSNGFVDFVYDDDQLIAIKDISGPLVRIERDIRGRIEHIEDAVGEKISFERDANGRIQRLTLRDGREWVVEYDGNGALRNIILPNQEVWGIQRDSWGTIVKLERSHDPDVSFSVHKGAWTSMDVPSGERWRVRRDGYNRIVEVMTPSGNIRLGRDILGQVESIDIQNHHWSIERDIFGNIVRWNDLQIEYGAWDQITAHQIGTNRWEWARDNAGRLVGVQTETTLNIEYDGMGNPIRWSKGDATSELKRNHWGWVSNIDNQWIQRDPRGFPEKFGVYDLSWRVNRNAAGFPLVIKAPYGVQLGLDLSDTNGIYRVRLPSGALQTFYLGKDGIKQLYTNEEGQEALIGTVPRTTWSSRFLSPSFSVRSVSSDAVGVYTVEQSDNVQIVDYDAFHFVQQVCDLSSCLHFSYDPRGRLVGIEDGTGLPTSIVWGWTGWGEGPLLIGGTTGVHTPLGMVVQSAGGSHFENPFWFGDALVKNGDLNDDGLIDEEMSSSPMLRFADAASFSSEGLHLEGTPVAIGEQQAILHDDGQVLQFDAPWKSGGVESQLFESVGDSSIWNRPVDMLFEMGIVSAPSWVSNLNESPLKWVSERWVDTGQEGDAWKLGVQSVPLNEDRVEAWILLKLLNGQADPSNAEILYTLFPHDGMWSVITGDFPFESNKCIPELAQFYLCG